MSNLKKPKNPIVVKKSLIFASYKFYVRSKIRDIRHEGFGNTSIELDEDVSNILYIKSWEHKIAETLADRFGVEKGCVAVVVLYFTRFEAVLPDKNKIH